MKQFIFKLISAKGNCYREFAFINQVRD